MAKAGFTAIWEFQVKKAHKAQFEEAYGESGAWVRLFKKSSEYLGTQLLKDEANENRYITIDQWSSRKAYEKFRQEHEAEYKEIDKVCEDWTEFENEIGRFEEVQAA